MMSVQRFTNQSNETIAYVTVGDSSHLAIVFVHGWLGDHTLWETTISEFAKTHYCIAPDLFGQGQSDIPKNADYSIPAQAKRILALLNHLNVEKFALVGHSMGGQICGYIASQVVPERVTHYVSVDGVVTGESSLGSRLREPLFWLGQYFPYMFTLSWKLARIKFIAKLLHGRLLFYDMNALPREVWYDRQRTFYDTRPHRANYKIMREIPQCDLTLLLPKITAKVLVITGEQDKVVYPAQAKVLAEQTPNAELVKIPECGHQPMFERFDVYIKALTTFLAS